VRAWRWVGLVGLSWLALSGCGPKPKQAGEAKDPNGSEESTKWESGSTTPSDVSTSTADTGGEAGTFDEQQAQVVLKRGARKAVECAKVIKDIPKGEGTVEVTFDGTKGQVGEVSVGSPFSTGPEQGQQCIKNAFSGEFIPPFPGKKTVPFTFTMP
jgi:hypothetical protein